MTLRWTWALLPVVVIAAAIIPNAVFVIIARHARPATVEPSPWLASRDEDARQAAVRAFAAGGWTLAARSPQPGALDFTLTGPEPAPAGQLLLRSRADASADRTVPWPAGASAAAIALPRGRWQVRWSSSDARLAAQMMVDVR